MCSRWQSCRAPVPYNFRVDNILERNKWQVVEVIMTTHLRLLQSILFKKLQAQHITFEETCNTFMTQTLDITTDAQTQNVQDEPFVTEACSEQTCRTLVYMTIMQITIGSTSLLTSVYYNSLSNFCQSCIKTREKQLKK